MIPTQRWIAALVYLFIDILYILFSKSFYSAQVAKVQGKPMVVGTQKLWAAFASYVVLVLGWLVLVAPPIERSRDWKTAALYGAVYGLAVYGVFNFTNYVMFQGYSIEMTIRDTLWGISWLTLFSVLYRKFMRS